MRFSQLTLSGVAVFAGIAAAHPSVQSFGLGKRAVSPDETCGMTGAGAGLGYTCGSGKCCSQYGWCGTSTDYCGAGCQSGYGATCGTGTITGTGTTTATVPTGTAGTDPNICGPTNNNLKCSTGCCSQYGYCGATADYCGGGCQPLFGTCTTVPGDDGTCGTQNGGKKCATGRCCSPEGYCGTGPEFCQAPDCQTGYGTCDADMTPSGASTLSVARTLVGSVPYGVDIYSCTEPGKIALTFDDGPYSYTGDLLTLLKTYGARATFFVTGVNLSKGRIDDASTPWPAIITRMDADGHQIAGHTWSHADLSKLTDADRTTEMVKLEMALRNIIGKFPTYMRPPYSSCTAACMATMKTLGYHIIYFDLDTEDYLHATADTIGTSVNIANNAIQGANPASTSLLSIAHDIHYTTVYTLVEAMLKTLTTKGFTAVTVGECMGDPKANWYRGSGVPPVSSTSSSSTTSVTSTTTTSTTTSVVPTPSSTTTTTTTTISSSSTKTSTTSTKTSTTTSTTPTSTCTTYPIGKWCAKKIATFSTRRACKTAANTCWDDAYMCTVKAGSTFRAQCDAYEVKVCDALWDFCTTCTTCTNAKWGGPIYP